MPTAPSPKDKGAVPALAAAFVTQFVAGLGFTTFSLLVSALAVATGLNSRDFGLWVTFFFIGTALSSPATGRLVHWLGGVRLIVFALLGMTAAMLVNLVGAWSATMLAAVLYGLCYGVQGPVGMTVVTERTPPARRGLFLALRHSAQPLGGVIAGRVLPLVMLAWGWQSGIFGTVAVLIAGVLFTLAVPALFRLETVPSGSAVRSGGLFARMLGTVFGLFAVPAELRLLWVAGLAFAFNQIAMIIFSYLYLLEVVGLSPVSAGIFLSNLQIAGLVGRPMFGWICDRTGRSQTVLGIIGLIAAAAILALLNFAEKGMPAWQLFLIAISCGIAGQAWNAVFTTAMSYKVAPERLAELNGRSFAFLSFGWMAGAPFFWTLIEFSGGYEWPFGIILTADLLAAIALLVSARRERA